MKKKSNASLGIGISRRGFWREIIISIVVFLLILIVVFFIRNYTGKAIGINPENTEDPLGIGLNPENMPQTPEEAGSVAGNYLKKEWLKILNSTAFGKVNDYCMKHQLPFQILFNQKYDFSMLFFLVFVLWLLDVICVANIFGFWGSLFPGLFVGVGSSILFAHLGLYRSISILIIKLYNFASFAWWKELIVWVVVIIIFVLFYFSSKMIRREMEARKKASEKRDIKEGVKESRAFVKGVKEGQEMTKDLRKLKKEIFIDGGGI